MRRTVATRAAVWWCGGAALLAVGGCSDHLVYVSETNLGVSVTAASQGTPKIALGYDRETFALVPRVDKHDGKEPEAMSLVSVSNVDTTGLDELVFNHYIVTGAAADKAAEDPQGLKQMRKAISGDAAGSP